MKKLKSKLDLDDLVLIFSIAIVFVSTFFIGPFLERFLTVIVIFGILGMAYNLLHGGGGMVSFGHAGFFAAGSFGAIKAFQLVGTETNFFGYVTSLAPQGNVVVIFFMGLAFALLASCIIGLITGYLASLTTGLYHSMVTMAVGMMIYVGARQSEFLGASQGMHLIRNPPFILDLNVQVNILFLSLISIFFTYVILKILMNSSFGQTLTCIKENESKLRSLGYNVRRKKTLAYAISGAISGLAGFLYLLNNYFVYPTYAHYINSGRVIVIALLGGIESIVGPLFGSMIWSTVWKFLIVKPGMEYFSLGVMFVIVLMVARRGFYVILKERFLKMLRPEE